MGNLCCCWCWVIWMNGWLGGCFVLVELERRSLIILLEMLGLAKFNIYVAFR